MTKRPSPLAAVSPANGSPRARIEWLSELVPSAEPRWLVEGLVPAVELIGMIGPPGAGKSFLAIDLAVQVASGRDWLGHRTERGLVIYVGAEDAIGLRMRLVAARDHHQIDEGSQLAFLAFDPNLRRVQDAQSLIAMVAEARATAQVPVSLIIIDTLNRTFGDGDENGADMAAYVGQLTTLQSRFHCAVMVLHHPPKSALGRTPRGHSSLPAACDTLLAVAGRKPRQLIVEKQRNGPADTTICFEIQPVSSPLPSTCVVARTAAGSSTDAGRRIGKDERVIFEVLAELQDQEGRAPPPDFPLEVRAKIQSDAVVPMLLWERAAKSSLPSAGRNADSVRRAFQRARQRLQSCGSIGNYRDWVWIID